MKTVIWNKRDNLVGVKALTIGVRHDGAKRFIAIATCSDEDNFSRPKGRRLVEGRLDVLQDGFSRFNIRKGLRGKTDVIMDYKGGDHTMQYANATGTVTATIDVPEWMLLDEEKWKEKKLVGQVKP